jgi:hypothetical protein
MAEKHKTVLPEGQRSKKYWKKGKICQRKASRKIAHNNKKLTDKKSVNEKWRIDNELLLQVFQSKW